MLLGRVMIVKDQHARLPAAAAKPSEGALFGSFADLNLQGSESPRSSSYNGALGLYEFRFTERSTMEEKRTMRRFSLRLPCLICVLDHCAGEAVYPTETENISSAGAYLRTGAPMPSGTRLSIELLVRRGSEAQPVRAESCVCLTGEVVRRDPAGLAVRFDHHYQIVRIAKLEQLSQARTQWMETLTQGFAPVTGPPDALERSAPRVYVARTPIERRSEIAARLIRPLPAT
jgi:hypothetical protein